jgi:hypothetical protein
MDDDAGEVFEGGAVTLAVTFSSRMHGRMGPTTPPATPEVYRCANSLRPSPRAIRPRRPALSGRWLTLARARCLAITLAIVALWLVGIPPHYQQHRSLDSSIFRDPDLVRANLAALGVPVGFYAGYLLAIEVLCTLGILAVAAVLLWRRSDEGAALLVALFLVALGVGYPPVAATSRIHASSAHETGQAIRR